MYNSTQITNKLNTLINGAVSAGFEESALNTMVASLKTAISNFYALDFSSLIQTNIEMLTHGLIRANIKYKDFTVPGASGSVPTGYNDVTQLFTVGTSIISTTQTTFNNSITQTLNEDGATYSYTSDLVDSWLNEWLNAITIVPANLALIADYASEVGLLSGIKIIYEAPEIVSVPTVDDFAKDIYITRKYKEVISTLSLSVYIPNIVS